MRIIQNAYKGQKYIFKGNDPNHTGGNEAPKKAICEIISIRAKPVGICSLGSQ